MGVHEQIAEAHERILKLEEQLAYMEQARDNALVMRDEAQRQKKQSGESAARRIEALIALVRRKPMWTATETAEEVIERELAAILAKEPYTLTESNLVEKSKEIRDLREMPVVEFGPLPTLRTHVEEAALGMSIDEADAEVKRLQYVFEKERVARKHAAREALKTAMFAFIAERNSQPDVVDQYEVAWHMERLDNPDLMNESLRVKEIRELLPMVDKAKNVFDEMIANIRAVEQSMNTGMLPKVETVKIKASDLPQKTNFAKCGVKDDRGRPCVRDEGHTPEGLPSLHVTDDGRGFHGPDAVWPPHKYVGFEETCLDCHKSLSEGNHPKDRDGAQ